MEKYLVTIEFRYKDAPKHEGGTIYKTKEVTLGVFDSFDDACKCGNELMENLESKYPLNVFANGQQAPKERFSKNGGPFGYKKDLISPLGYLKTPFDFYAKIQTLRYDDVNGALAEVVEAVKRYRQHKANAED